MILGIDGGGSKTQFLLVNRAGEVLGAHQTGTSHHLQIGFSAFRQLITAGIAQLLPSGDPEKELGFVSIGVPGLGESHTADQTLHAILAQMFPCPFEAVNDVKLAWAGALANQPGVCLLAGTGSMAYAVDEQGRDLRCGGWGEPFGDEGSAYWLGSQACTIYSQMADGRRKKGPLYFLMKEELGLVNDFLLVERVHGGGDRRQCIARLAPILAQAAQKGDEQALEAFRQAAVELAAMVKGVLQNFSGRRPVQTSYQGGVFKAGAFFLSLVKQALSPLPVVLAAPAFSPVEGACLYAAARLGLDLERFCQQLRAGSCAIAASNASRLGPNGS